MIRVLFLNTRSALGADVAVHLSIISHFNPDLTEAYIALNRNSDDLDKTRDALGSMPEDHVVTCDLGQEISGTGSGPVHKFGGIAKNLSALATLPALARFVKHNRIDIIHSTDRPRDALLATLLAKLTGRPNVLHVHIKWFPGIGRIPSWALRQCTAVLTISQFTRKAMLESGLDEKKIYTTLNATDATLFDPAKTKRSEFRKRFGIDEDAPLIGIVARIMVWKGHLELIEALAHVKNILPDVRLAIIGEEDLLAAESEESFADKVRKRAAELDLTGSIIWTGWQDNMPEVMNDLDVLAMPSWEEPFGLAVTEGMAMQKPVVGFSTGALPEIVTDGKDGILTPFKDTESLGEALLRLLLNPQLREAMGINGRKRVLQDFTPQRQSDEVSEIYRKILREEGRGKREE